MMRARRDSNSQPSDPHSQATPRTTWAFVRGRTYLGFGSEDVHGGP
jgi:hypothetical protein